MKINKRTAISTLALIGLTLGTSVSAAEVMARRPRLENLTSAQLSVLDEAHQLHKLGKDEEAKKLIESAGIEVPKMNGKKHGHGPKFKSGHMGMGQLEKFRTIIEQDDFESFQKVVEGTPMEKIINTEEKFNALVQAHELRVEGKYEEATEVLNDAGLKTLGFGKKR